MKATVIAVSSSNGLVAIKDEEGNYSVFEPFGEIFDPGDTVQGNFDDLGDVNIRNITYATTSEVFFEDILTDRQTALSALE